MLPPWYFFSLDKNFTSSSTGKIIVGKNHSGQEPDTVRYKTIWNNMYGAF